MNAVDTNILIYAQDPRDPVKQEQAFALVNELEDGVLLWQVACEFLAASRKLTAFGYHLDDAWAHLESLLETWAFVSPPGWQILERSKDLMSRYSLSLWDSHIAALCIESGVERLYSEDFGYSKLDDLAIVNPFAN